MKEPEVSDFHQLLTDRHLAYRRIADDEYKLHILPLHQRKMKGK
jgi:hypothetical protein